MSASRLAERQADRKAERKAGLKAERNAEREAEGPTGRLRGWVLVTVLAAVAGGWAQEGPSAAELKRMYEDVVGQLKGAQVRKNELAAENEKLSARITELEKRVKELQSRNRDLETDAAGWAEKTWQLRATRAAWQGLLARDPIVKDKWDRYLGGEAQMLLQPQARFDLNWPFGG